MLEVPEFSHKPVKHEILLEDCIRGLSNTSFLDSEDEIVSKFYVCPSFRPRIPYI
jgi:hypothetical protein